MRILLTNDDGIEAKGLAVLREIAAELSDDVWVVAPETNQSGASHSLTLHEPLRCRPVSDRTYAVRGTPTDCVLMAVLFLMTDSPPDLVLSGVNCGQNLADDINYSGTVAGAIEGSLLGVPSIALSLAIGHDDADEPIWETPTKLGASLVRRLLAAEFPEGVVMNVNFPAIPPAQVTGMVATRQGKRDPGLMRIEDRIDPRGLPYYWFGFQRRRSDPPEGTDLWAIASGSISVTPLYLNLTHQKSLERLGAVLSDTSGQRGRRAG